MTNGSASGAIVAGRRWLDDGGQVQGGREEDRRSGGRRIVRYEIGGKGDPRGRAFTASRRPRSPTARWRRTASTFTTAPAAIVGEGMMKTAAIVAAAGALLFSHG
jgi:hypothetical protein